MKIPINLASQPFRRDRAILAASIAVTVLLCVTLGVLISLALADRAQLADVRTPDDPLIPRLRAALSGATASAAEQASLAFALARRLGQAALAHSSPKRLRPEEVL